MDTLLGVRGDGFCVLAADGSAARSIMVYQTDKDKILPLDDHKLLALSGPDSDCSTFGEWVQKNMKLYELNNDYALGTFAAANFIRRELATALRKGPYQTNILLAGHDSKDGASLYFLDYLGSMRRLNYGAHGYGSNFTLSIFDREWKEGLTLNEALDIVRKCIKELQTRFLINQPNFTVKIVDKEGTRIVKLNQQ